MQIFKSHSLSFTVSLFILASGLISQATASSSNVIDMPLLGNVSLEYRTFISGVAGLDKVIGADYRGVVHVKPENVKDTFGQKLTQFAESGEASAIQLTFNLRKDWGEADKEHYLKGLLRKNPDNINIKNFLARSLSNQGKLAEALVLYQQIEASGKPTYDADFRINYAACLMQFKQDDIPSLYKAADIILTALERDYNPNIGEDACYSGFIMHLCEQSILHKQPNLILKLARQADNSVRKKPLREALVYTLKGTEYEQVVYQSMGDGFVGINAKLPLGPQVTAILKLAEELERQEQVNRETAQKVVAGNFEALLQDSQVRDIPNQPKYQHLFVGFNPASPSEQHLKIWIRLIINADRNRLLSYPDPNPGVDDILKVLDNKTLEVYGLAVMKRIMAKKNVEAK